MEAWQTIMLLGAVVIVCSVILPRRVKADVSNHTQSQTVRNMETALEQFMENMESDNHQIVELVTKNRQEYMTQISNRDDRISELEKRSAALERMIIERDSYPAALASSSESAASMNNEMSRDSSHSEVYESQSAQELTIQSRYSELFALYDNGKSIETIAKKLGLNKGEVQLILQLSRQEEAGRNG